MYLAHASGPPRSCPLPSFLAVSESASLCTGTQRVTMIIMKSVEDKSMNKNADKF